MDELEARAIQAAIDDDPHTDFQGYSWDADLSQFYMSASEHTRGLNTAIRRVEDWHQFRAFAHLLAETTEP